MLSWFLCCFIFSLTLLSWGCNLQKYWDILHVLALCSRDSKVHSHSPTHILTLTHTHTHSQTHIITHIHTYTHTHSPFPSLSRQDLLRLWAYFRGHGPFSLYNILKQPVYALTPTSLPTTKLLLNFVVMLFTESTWCAQLCGGI